MGLASVNIEIANPSELSMTETVELLVDSGAYLSVVPREILEGLGIRPHSERRLRLADGSVIVRERGTASSKYGERIGGADVIFGNPGDAHILGVIALESLGLGLDQMRRELVDIPTVLYGSIDLGPG